MNLKKCLTLLMAGTFVLLLSGCLFNNKGGPYNGKVSKKTTNPIDVEYWSFNGNDKYEVNLSAGDNLTYEITTAAGSLTVEIVSSDDSEKPYSGNFDINTQVTKAVVNIQKSGKYFIKLTGKNHSGAYKFSW